MRTTSIHARQGMRSGRFRPRRRRAGIRTRVRYQRPTASVQKRQIATLAALAVKNARILRQHTALTDYVRAERTSLIGDSGFLAAELMNMDELDTCNRASLDVLTSQQVHIRNMIFEWSADSHDKVLPCMWDVFIVTIKGTSNTFVPGAPPVLESPSQFAEMGQYSAPRLNSGMFRVFFAKSFRSFPIRGSGGGGAGTDSFPLNPYTTYKKGSANLRVNYTIKAPSSLSWKELTQNDLAPSKRLYVLYRCRSDDIANDAVFRWACYFTMQSQT